MQFLFNLKHVVYVLNFGCCRIKLPKRWPSTINTGTLPKFSVTYNRQNTEFFPHFYIFI